MSKITKVKVKNLFGIFNHEIPINKEDHITIIHSPNGFGKTVLLKMISSLFNRKYSNLYGIPFDAFEVEFEDQGRLILKKGRSSKDKMRIESGWESYELTLDYKKIGMKNKTYTIEQFKKEKYFIPLSFVEREIAELERIGPAIWLHKPTNEIISYEEVIERYRDELPMLPRIKKDIPEWLNDIHKETSVRFIETQRLIAYKRPSRPREDVIKYGYVPAVKKYTEDLINLMQAKLAEYANLSQSLDRSFPLRLVKSDNVGSAYNKDKLKDALKKELESLEQKRKRLEEVGILDKEQTEVGAFLNMDIEENKIPVLSVYVEDVKKKLATLDELANKIELLFKIINNRFLYKNMSINKKDGIVFTGLNNEPIPLENLSSGEQHELVLFNELLFKVEKNSLVLIDEPELSLHVVWQQQFLKDLLEITKLAGFDILIATHSPQIIHDRWDLTVELKGPENVETSNTL